MPKAMKPVPGTPISNGASNIYGAKINKITPRIIEPKHMAHQEIRTEIVRTQIAVPSISQKAPDIFSIIPAFHLCEDPVREACTSLLSVRPNALLTGTCCGERF